MSLKIKSCSYPVESALLKSLVPSEAKPLLYKKKSFDVYMYVVSAHTQITFVFESRSLSKKSFDMTFHLKGLKLEDSAKDN